MRLENYSIVTTRIIQSVSRGGSSVGFTHLLCTYVHVRARACMRVCVCHDKNKDPTVRHFHSLMNQTQTLSAVY